MLVATCWLLVFTSGDQNTTLYLALFAVITAAGPLLGIYGLLTSIIAAGSSVAERFLIDHIQLEPLITLAAVLFTPIIAAGLLWLRQRYAINDNLPQHESLTTVAGVQASDIVINAIGDGVIAIDAKGTVTLINPAAQQLVGWDNQDAIGLSYKSVIRLVDQKNSIIKEDDNSDIIARVLSTNNPLKTDEHKSKTQ